MTNFAQHIDFIPVGNSNFPDVLGESQARYGAFSLIIPPGTGKVRILYLDADLFGTDYNGYVPRSIYVEAIVTAAKGLTPYFVTPYTNYRVNSNKILITGIGRLINNGFSPGGGGATSTEIIAPPTGGSYTNKPFIVIGGDEVECFSDGSVTTLRVNITRSTFTEDEEISLLVKGTYLLL